MRVSIMWQAMGMGLADITRHASGSHVSKGTSVQCALDDVVGNGPGRYCSPRHGVRRTSDLNKRGLKVCGDDVAGNTCQALPQFHARHPPAAEVRPLAANVIPQAGSDAFIFVRLIISPVLKSDDQNPTVDPPFRPPEGTQLKLP